MTARHESQKVFAFNTRATERAIVPDAGTSVTFEVSSDKGDESQWVLDPKSPITSPDILFCAGVKMRLTPDVGGFYFDGSYDEPDS